MMHTLAINHVSSLPIATCTGECRGDICGVFLHCIRRQHQPTLSMSYPIQTQSERTTLHTMSIMNVAVAPMLSPLHTVNMYDNIAPSVGKPVLNLVSSSATPPGTTFGGILAANFFGLFHLSFLAVP